MHQSVRELEAADERLREDERALGELQRELDQRTQLELELRQAKQAADSAVMAKGEFLATMSHEIRTPLNGITPMLDLLMHARLAPEHAELVRTAYLSSQQMQRIVDDILDYSKLESDKLDLEVTGFNLRELLEGVIQLIERPAQTKGLRIGLQIDPGVRLAVRGDPVRLRQVLSNLLGNAVKFTERGNIGVSLRRIGETAAQHQLRFEVRDTGIGIAPESQPRLFQAFNQADASTTRLYGGTGLGLAISRRIVELMGGRIGVESEPGVGSTFWFELPLLKAQGDMPAADRQHHEGRVLLLSADPRLRLRLSMLLPNWGLRVTAVETTQEALDRLRTAASQGPAWAYTGVVCDLAGMRNTAVALYRNVTRQVAYGQLQLICLYGDEPVADELRQGSATLLSRQAPDADLRVAILGEDAVTPPMPPQADLMPSDPPGASPSTGAADLSPRAVAATVPAASTADVPRSASARKPRVLLVEDNPVNLMVGQRLLGVLGITCDTASNGEAALLRISASRYDIVLMDCQMPVMDGYTATRRWREHEAEENAGRRLPIIAMTANAMAGDRQKCLDAGMDDYLAKPVTRSELERCIDRWYTPELRAQEFSAVIAGDEASADDGDVQAAALPPATTPASASGFEPEPVPVPASVPAPVPTPAPATSTETAAAAAPAAATPTRSPPVPAAAVAGTGVAATTPATPAATISAAPRPAAPLPPVIDQEVLEDLRVMLGTELDRLIDVFLDDTPRLLAAMENAVDGPDYDALRDAAHSLKSSSANLGAMSLSAAAKRIELGARERRIERPAVAVALASNEFARVRRLLRETQPASAG
nr:hybrid sensor histidine kinase/response regulator [Luteimonas sp. BDR2-5]